MNNSVVNKRRKVAILGDTKLMSKIATSIKVGIRFMSVSPRVISREKTAKKAASRKIKSLASVMSLFMFFLLFLSQIILYYVYYIKFNIIIKVLVENIQNKA